MKIIRVTTLLDYGGIERKMVNTSTWQDKNEWIFIALGKGGFAEKSIRQNGKQVFCLNQPYKIPSIKTVIKLYLVFKHEKPDVVHTAGAEANFHGILAAKLAGVPIKIAEEIGIPSHSRMARLIFSNLFRLTDYVIGESNLVVEFLRKNYSLPEAKLKKVFNFILNPNYQYNEKIEDGKFRIVSISRLVKVKNIEAVIRILPQLLKYYPNIIYTIVGDGPEDYSLKNLVQELGVQNAVEFPGFTNNPFLYLQKSDLFLLNSLSEGFSNSLLEAMYCGIPCLSTLVGGAEDMIKEGINGWLISSGKDDELLSKLKYILTLEPHVLRNIGKNGQQTVQEKFTLYNHVQELLKLYDID